MPDFLGNAIYGADLWISTDRPREVIALDISEESIAT